MCIRDRSKIGTVKNIGVSAVVDSPKNSSVENVWVQIPVLDIVSANELLKGIFQNKTKVRQWLDGLNPSGNLKETTVRLSLPGGSLDYFTHISDGSFDAYKGTPRAERISGIAVGNEYAATLELNSKDMYVEFGNLFEQGLTLRQATGALDFYFRPNLFGIRGDHVAVYFGDTEARGGFSLATPKTIRDRQLTLALSIKDISIPVAKQFIPIKLPGQLRPWLLKNVLDGQVNFADLVFSSYVKPQDIPSPVQIEMRINLDRGELRFHEEWPLAEELKGELLVGARMIQANITSANTLNNSLSHLHVSLPRDLNFVELTSEVDTTGSSVLNYLRKSPLIDWMPFLKPEWELDGPLTFQMKGIIPIQDASREIELSLQMDLPGVDLLLPDMNLEVGGLRGKIAYKYPYAVVSDHLDGTLLGGESVFSIDSPEDRIDVQLAGGTTIATILDWLEIEDPEVARGTFSFAGTLNIFTAEDRQPRLTVDSDFRGVTIVLPGELAKKADETASVQVTYQANPIYDELNFVRDDTMQGWLHVQDGEIIRGAVGINQQPALVDSSSNQVVITGSLPEISGSTGASTQEPFLNLNWAILDFRIDRLDLEDNHYDDLVLNGKGTKDSSSLRVKADVLDGEFSFQRGEYPRVDINTVRFEESEAGVSDPLEDVNLSFLRPADVSIADVSVGDESYGSWKFKLRNIDSGWKFSDLTADIRGVHIESSEGGVWKRPQLSGEESSFTGTVSASDLAGVLPQWGYAPSVENKSLTMFADLRWSGSPLAIAMLSIEGTVDLKINEGRFLDVDSANNTLRIFSLLNFTAIVKRMSLDFSDVFGKGISFDTVSANLSFNKGIMAFDPPLVMQGTGSRFKVNGTVDLNNGELNNDVLVTFPVNRSLPWYAGYLAIANPLAGVGVLIGEKIFRNQLELFSSAKYSVSGSIGDPKVELIGIFTKTMEDGNGRGESETGGTGQPEAENPGTNSVENIIDGKK